ncbi:MAG: hypothetical protein IPK07_18150 [Deltaproteobacteria bacterium]|nr:hypothetical protein [Deltaproteobacteria bacterium]
MTISVRFSSAVSRRRRSLHAGCAVLAALVTAVILPCDSRAAAPELVVTGLAVDDDYLVQGESFTITATVENAGTAASAGTLLGLWGSPIPAVGPDAAELAVVAVPGLDPGASISLDQVVTLSQAGSLFLFAIAAAVPGEAEDTISEFLPVEVHEPLALGEGADRFVWVYLGSEDEVFGHGFTAGSVIQVYVAGPGGVATPYGPFLPTSWSPTRLTWTPPIDILLGHGLMSLVVVNTDQGFDTSAPVCRTLVGTRLGANPPAIVGMIEASDPRPPNVLETADCSVPFTWGFFGPVEPGQALRVSGESFANPVANLFTATGNLGPLSPQPGGTGNVATFTIPANAPVGPAMIQLVNAPYTGNAQSNAVIFTIGAGVDVQSVVQDGGTITVTGQGFSPNAVINLHNQQGAEIVNLGGLDENDQPRIPLVQLTPTRFEFEVPAGAVPGRAFVVVVNPPFLAITSTGSDGDGALILP